MSRLRANLITNQSADGAPTVQNGLIISGITTFTNVNSAIGAIIKNTAHDSELQILATYSNKNSKLLFGDAADDDVGIIDYDHNTNNMIFTVNANERVRINNYGGVGIGTGNFSGQLNNEVGLAIHGSSNDNCRISITTPTKSNSRIGYFGLSNRFGLDVHNGFEIRDAEDSYATRLLIDNNGQFALGRTGQITGNGNSSTSVFEQLSNSNYPLALHSSQTNKRGLMIFYATTGAGNAGDPFIVCTDNTNNKFQITSDGTITTRGNILPAVNNDKDLGSSSLRWANLYTQDLHLSNEAKKDTGGNSVDGTWGDWTLQEGESDVFMINNRSGKKYMFMLKEVV